MDSADNARLRSLLKHLLGTEILAALADPDTVEILLNPDGVVWQERLGGGPMRRIGVRSVDEAAALAGAVAGSVGLEITHANPYLETELLLDGSRISVQVPPIVRAPTLSIRKHASAVFGLDEYVGSGIMTERQAAIIRAGVGARQNILLVGGTGSGKTTLLNAILRELMLQRPNTRPVIIEDTAELQCVAENQVRYKTSLSVSMQQLVRISLRMRPDTIIVGEVRGPEALDLLDAWSTGHRGAAASIHGENAAIGLSRLLTCVSRNADAPSPIAPLITQAIDLIVSIQRTDFGRCVNEVLRVTGHDEKGRFTMERLD